MAGQLGLGESDRVIYHVFAQSLAPQSHSAEDNPAPNAASLNCRLPP